MYDDNNYLSILGLTEIAANWQVLWTTNRDNGLKLIVISRIYMHDMYLLIGKRFLINVLYLHTIAIPWEIKSFDVSF